MKRFESTVALITGGRSGIGQAIARRLQQEGARVITAQRGQDTELECIGVDFTEPEGAADAIAKVLQLTGRLDVLVNNAGMMQEQLAEEMSLEDWTRNLTTPFALLRAALPHLRKTQGRIVNVGSTEGLGSKYRTGKMTSLLRRTLSDLIEGLVSGFIDREC